VRIATADQMREFGAQLATVLRPGDLVLLSGDLGAGKTTLTQGIAQGLSVTGPVTSPTFVIARVYRGPVPLVHVDAYRLGSLREVDDLDLDADLERSITVVEWGEGLVEQLSVDRLVVRIAADDDDARTVTCQPVGARWAETAVPACD
jgi:tRNA threonylcarbamoyladenosine biosynthesis protein TsaE